MPRFLIEVPHDSDARECTRVVRVFLSTGSHFLTHAEWGCKDGVHSAWMMVDVDSKAEAFAIVPPGFRDHARVVGLHHFTLEEVAPRHRPASPGDAAERPGG